MASRNGNRSKATKNVVIPASYMSVGEYCVAEAARHYPVKFGAKKAADTTKTTCGNIQFSCGPIDQAVRQTKLSLNDYFGRLFSEKNWHRSAGHDPHYKNHKATQPTVHH